MPVSTATNTAGPPIRISRSAQAIAIPPDGKTLYALTGKEVIPISTATNTPGTPIRHPYGSLGGLVITP